MKGKIKMAVTKIEKAELVKKFGATEKDTGNVRVQVALLTKRIQSLTAHLKSNDKDHTARRSLLVLVGQRKSLLAYLEKQNRDAYLELIHELGLRK